MKTVKEECELALTEVVEKLQTAKSLTEEDIQLLLFARLMEEESNERTTK